MGTKSNDVVISSLFYRLLALLDILDQIIKHVKQQIYIIWDRLARYYEEWHISYTN